MVAPNLPAGLTVFVNRDFNTKAVSRYDSAGAQGFEPSNESMYPTMVVANDPSAGGSASSVMRYTFPAGLASGSGPVTMQYFFRNNPLGQTARTAYVATWVKLHSNWRYGSKLFYLNWTGGSYVVFANSVKRVADGTGPVQVQLRNNHGGFLPCCKNNSGTGKELVRDKWVLIELLVQLSSTPNAPDGAVKIWVDGALTVNKKEWSLPGTAPFINVKYSTILGTVGGIPLPAAMNLDFDHVVIAVQ